MRTGGFKRSSQQDRSDDLIRGLELETFAGSFVELSGDGIELSFGEPVQVGALSSRSANEGYRPCRFRPRRGLTPPAATSILFAVVQFTPICSPTSLANFPAWNPSHACCTRSSRNLNANSATTLSIQ